MKNRIYNSLVYSTLLALSFSSVSSHHSTDGSWGTTAQGQTYVVTPAGFKDPPGPSEGAGVVVDPFRFLITGSAGEEVNVVLTLPDSFSSDNGTGLIPLMNWTYGISGIGDDMFWDAGWYRDSVTVGISSNGMTFLWVGATSSVPITAPPGPYTAALTASYAGKETTAYRSLEVVLSGTGSWGTVEQGQSYVITPGGFKEPPGPGEGAGVTVDAFRFLITGSHGEDVTVVLTLPDSFTSNIGTGIIPLMNWQYSFCDDGFVCAGPYSDSVTVPIYSNGMTPLLVAATLSVPITAPLGPYTAALRATYADKETTVYRSIEVVLSTDAGDEKSVPLYFGLRQNYPNPFNPSTQITYTLPSASTVSVKVFDILGQEIASLVNERQEAGEYRVEWNAEGLPGGVYFYRLVAGNFIETKKMVLLR